MVKVCHISAFAQDWTALSWRIQTEPAGPCRATDAADDQERASTIKLRLMHSCRKCSCNMVDTESIEIVLGYLGEMDLVISANNGFNCSNLLLVLIAAFLLHGSSTTPLLLHPISSDQRCSILRFLCHSLSPSLRASIEFLPFMKSLFVIDAFLRVVANNKAWNHEDFIGPGGHLFWGKLFSRIYVSFSPKEWHGKLKLDMNISTKILRSWKYSMHASHAYYTFIIFWE